MNKNETVLGKIVLTAALAVLFLYIKYNCHNSL